VGAGEQFAQFVIAKRQGAGAHADPVGSRQVGGRANAGAVDVAKEQIGFDLAAQILAKEIQHGEHLVACDRKHAVAAPFEVFAGAWQAQAEGGDLLGCHAEGPLAGW